MWSMYKRMHSLRFIHIPVKNDIIKALWVFKMPTYIVQIVSVHVSYYQFGVCGSIAVFPVNPWTREKICGMFIVSQPIRCEMKPQKITNKPQNGLIMTSHETTSSLFLQRGIFNFAVFKYWSFSFSISALLSPKNRYERHFTKSEVNQEDRIRHS